MAGSSAAQSASDDFSSKTAASFTLREDSCRLFRHAFKFANYEPLAVPSTRHKGRRQCLGPSFTGSNRRGQVWHECTQTNFRSYMKTS